MILDATDCLQEDQDSQTAEPYKSWRPCTLEVGNLVMLSTKDLPITYVNQDPVCWKLQYLWARPYKVIEFWGPHAVELQLLADMTIYDTINISRLKKYTADPASERPPPPPSILTIRNNDGTAYFHMSLMQSSYIRRCSASKVPNSIKSNRKAMMTTK